MRSYYKLLFGPLNEVFPWECIWCAKVPKRVSFFSWTAARNEILTIDNLVKRGQSLVNRCCLCCCDGEIVDHLLFHCKFSHALWSAIFEVFRIHWVLPKIVSSPLCLEKLVWKASVNHMEYGPGMFNVAVWTECNARIFEDNKRTLDLLKALLFGTLFQWPHFGVLQIVFPFLNSYTIRLSF